MRCVPKKKYLLHCTTTRPTTIVMQIYSSFLLAHIATLPHTKWFNYHFHLDLQTDVTMMIAAKVLCVHIKTCENNNRANCRQWSELNLSFIKSVKIIWPFFYCFCRWNGNFTRLNINFCICGKLIGWMHWILCKISCDRT